MTNNLDWHGMKPVSTRRDLCFHAEGVQVSSHPGVKNDVVCRSHSHDAIQEHKSQDPRSKIARARSQNESAKASSSQGKESIHLNTTPSCSTRGSLHLLDVAREA